MPPAQTRGDDTDSGRRHHCEMAQTATARGINELLPAGSMEAAHQEVVGVAALLTHARVPIDRPHRM
ncbi:MAG: hypothetical protein WKF82_05540 [Nocardioidaceae bacterium]